MTTDALPGVLSSACAEVREAGPDDVVAGVTPRFVARPASVAEAAAVMRAAADEGLAALPRGGGTRLAWGCPPTRCDLVIDTRGLNRVLEHAAGDLVVRVQAGVTLDQLAATLARAGQRLALDPPAGPLRDASPSSGPGDLPSGPGDPSSGSGPSPSDRGDPSSGSGPSPSDRGDPSSGSGPSPSDRGGPSSGSGPSPSDRGDPSSSSGHSRPAATDAGRGTIGGLLATGVAGPLRLRYGTPRDLAIGIKVVRADGTVASSGGKVVKNVAGYDLGKLFAGSYGTLGLIVEAAFRLHPLPAATAFVTLDAADADAAQATVAAAADSPLAPSAAEIDRPAREGPVRVGVLLEGDPEGVAERCERLTGLLGDGAATSPHPPAWWGRGAAAEPDGTVIRIGFWAEALAPLLAAVDAAASDAGLDPLVGGSAAAGVIHAAVRPDAPPAAVAGFVHGLRAALRGLSVAPAAAAELAGAVTRAGPLASPAAASPSPADAPPSWASVVVLHAPAEVRAAVDMWGPVPSLGLMRAVKAQFDPQHRMAPGRFAGGI